ncbi:DUF3089 domain-containing protein [Nocardia sp. NPDC059228]|uniref:DUF3089 domain-containing protein n=1 Tax=Nocardia sp. NPDC059228 TaxID=3346777 RepID=UPI0036A30BDA
MKHVIRMITAAALAVGSVSGMAVAAPPDATTGTVWLCRPGTAVDPCDQDADGRPGAQPRLARYPDGGRAALSVTTVGHSDLDDETATASAPPGVDCFYVYPTVDLVPNPVTGDRPQPRAEELAVLLAQVGPLLDRCRMFAPLYRQDTLPQLAQHVVTGSDGYAGPGFADVLAAWDDYWAHDNVGPGGDRRGVILLGHSQGSVALEQLIRDRIDGRPDTTAQLVSAVLLGGKMQVPDDRPTGGGADPDSTFQHLPLCGASAPVPAGCVIAYSAYAAGHEPGSKSLAWSAAPGHRIACVDPAALRHTADPAARTPLDTVMPTRNLLQGTDIAPAGHLTAVLRDYRVPSTATGFTRYPGLLTSTCRYGPGSDGSVAWLEIGGDLDAVLGTVGDTQLGLHVADYSVALGDLAAVLDRQSATWLARR